MGIIFCPKSWNKSTFHNTLVLMRFQSKSQGWERCHDTLPLSCFSKGDFSKETESSGKLLHTSNLRNQPHNTCIYPYISFFRIIYEPMNKCNRYQFAHPVLQLFIFLNYLLFPAESFPSLSLGCLRTALFCFVLFRKQVY